MFIINTQISGFDVFPNNTAKPSSLLHFMQDAAAGDVTQYGAGYKELLADDMIFVLTKIKLSIDKQIGNDFPIKVKSWGKSMSGASFIRDYTVFNDEGILARATSQWVLISYSDRRLLRTTTLSPNISSNQGEDSGLEMSRRILPPDGAKLYEAEHKVVLSDIDINNHLNNSRYADLITDNCAIDFIANRVSEIEIHYMNELHLNDSVKISSYSFENGATVIGMKADGTVSFSAEIKAEPV